MSISKVAGKIGLLWMVLALTTYAQEPDEEIAEEGRKLYNKTCWVCHGIKGSGKGPGSFHLASKPANFRTDSIQEQSDAALFDKIYNGYGNMDAFSDELTKDEVKAIVAFIRTLKEE